MGRVCTACYYQKYRELWVQDQDDSPMLCKKHDHLKSDADWDRFFGTDREVMAKSAFYLQSAQQNGHERDCLFQALKNATFYCDCPGDGRIGQPIEKHSATLWRSTSPPSQE